LNYHTSNVWWSAVECRLCPLLKGLLTELGEWPCLGRKVQGLEAADPKVSMLKISDFNRVD